MINLLIKKVLVFDDKIEISFNYTKSKSVEGEETIIKLFSKTFSKTRKYKGNTTKTIEKPYDVYIKI